MTLFTDLQNAGLPVVSASDTPPRQATFSRSLSDDELELYLDIANPDRITQREETASDTAQLKAEYQATIAQLEQIENAVSPTNAQVIGAVKFLARTVRLILRLIARSYRGTP